MTKLTIAQKQTRNMKRAAYAAFLFGAVTSLAANIYASNHTPVGLITGAVPAVALLVSIYLFENAPKSFWIKMAVLVVIVVAAWASYWHLVEVFTDGGADLITSRTLPLTIDAMMGIAQGVLNKKAPARKPVRRVAAKVATVRKLKIAS